MRTLITLLAAFMLSTASIAQTIEGDRLLDLVGRTITDPLFLDLKAQETFYTDSWDDDFTIYIVQSGTINEVELQNGKLRYNSTERYGKYRRKLPMGLKWSMSSTDLRNKFGSPITTIESMGLVDYKSGEWTIRASFENGDLVAISFKKPITPKRTESDSGGAPASSGGGN